MGTWNVKGLQRYLPLFTLTLSRQRSLSYRNQFIDLQSKSVDCFLYDRDLRHCIVHQCRKKKNGVSMICIFFQQQEQILISLWQESAPDLI